MPSLILGYRISTAILTNSYDLAIQFVITNGTYWCSRMPSVFSSARGMGVNTAVVGWYVPYAKLFGKDLNYCSWCPFPLYEPYEPTHALTFGAAMRQQIQCLAGPLHVRQAFVAHVSSKSGRIHIAGDKFHLRVDALTHVSAPCARNLSAG